MLSTRKREAQPIPGYRLLEPLGEGGCGEVWKCLAPGDLVKAIKFVASDPIGFATERGPEKELEAVQRVKSIRHPFLLTMERVEVIDGELMIVMELADCSLRDVLRRRQEAGAAGLGRVELLDFLGEAANALDFMALRCGLQHLDIKPENLFVVADHVKVADFGLVQSLSGSNKGVDNCSGGLALHALTPRYAAPELFENRLSSSCDQYSLAIVYVELLTGKLPFGGKSNRQLVLQRANAVPDLDALPESDRPLIARALHRDPNQRFASCTELVNALLAATEAAPACAPTHALLHAVNVPNTPVLTPTTLPAHPACAGDRFAAGAAPARNPLARYLPDHQFRRLLSRSPTTESWAAETAGGQRWLVRLFSGVLGRSAAREQEALQRLGRLQHDLIQPARLTRGGPGCLLAVTEWTEECLGDRLAGGLQPEDENRRRGRLLDWLWPIAEGLDDLARDEGLAHLGLCPSSLVMTSAGLQIADFGLLPLLWKPAGQLRSQLKPRYTAPEVLAGQGDSASDQYSLAVIFQELLTGRAPWRGQREGEPDLHALPEEDRATVARALDADPQRRFPSCLALLEALERPGCGGKGMAVPKVDAPAASRTLLAELVADLGGRLATGDGVPVWQTQADGGLALGTGFCANLPGGDALPCFESWCRNWQAEVLQKTEGAVMFRVGAPGSLWERLVRRPPALLVEVHWTAAQPATPSPRVTVHARGLEKDFPPDQDLLRQRGPALLLDLRAQLQSQHERRTQERWLWTQPVRVAFVLADGQVTEPVDCLGKDLSLGGMGIYLPCEAPSNDVRLFLTPPSRSQPVTLAGTCVRLKRCGEDWYEAGVRID